VSATTTDPGFAGDQEPIDGLFSDIGRREPHAILRGSAQVGCRHAIARRILHRPNFR
jgi:hypothetical protein